MKKDLKNGLAVGLLVVLPGLFWLPVLLKNLAFVYRDSFNFFYPIRMYAARRMHQGHVPFWASHMGGGTPFFANPQTALFYPPQILLYLFPNNIGLNLEMIAHFSWAACGMFWLCRSLKLTRMAAFYSGICFAFGSLMVVSIEYLALLTVLAWLPWCWWGFLRLWSAPSAKAAVAFALIWACAVLAGMLDVLVMAAVGCLPLAMGFGCKGFGFSKKIPFLALAMVLALTLTAFQWVPFFHELQLSNRQAEAFSRGITSWSLHPFEILGVLFPLLFGGISCKWFGQLWLQGMYLGILPTALLFFLPIRKREIRLLLAMAAFFFLLSMGRYVPGVSFFLEHVPLFSRIRFPSKYFVMVIFLLGICLGFAFDQWRHLPDSAKHRLASIFFAGAVIGLGLIWFLPEMMLWVSQFSPSTFLNAAAAIWRESRREALCVQASLLGLSVVLLLMTHHRGLRRCVPHAVVLFSVGELMLYLPFFVVTAPARFLEDPARNIGLLNHKNFQTRIIRFDQYAPVNNWYHFGSDYRSRLHVAKESLSPLLPILHDVGMASVYQGLEPLSYTRAYRALDYELKLKNNTNQPLEVVREWGITHGISSVPFNHPGLHLLSSTPFFLYEINPRPWLCFFRDGSQSEFPCDIARPNENAMKVVRTGTIPENANQLIVRERYHPNWQLQVDGVRRDVKPSAAHELGMAAQVKKTDRVFEFTYRETGWPFLAYLALASAMACIFVLLFDRPLRLPKFFACTGE